SFAFVVLLHTPHFTLVKEKARLLESNRASSTAHGGRRIYLRERPLDPVFLPPPLFPRALDDPLDLAPRLAEACRAAFLAPPFFAAAFFAGFLLPEPAFFALVEPEPFLPPLLAACFRPPALDAAPAE